MVAFFGCLFNIAKYNLYGLDHGAPRKLLLFGNDISCKKVVPIVVVKIENCFSYRFWSWIYNIAYFSVGDNFTQSSYISNKHWFVIMEGYLCNLSLIHISESTRLGMI